MQRKNYNKKIILPDGSKLRIGIVVSEFNKDITENMLTGALSVLDGAKVKKANVNILRVPGSFEIPYGCLKLIKSKKPNAIIALGCIIKGETTHDQYIASAAANGIMDVMLKSKVPIAFGIITTNNLKQAEVRSTGKTNKGREAAITALEMALM
jgi:6,7-dimethyl-8-ribityllumazine synthase